MDISRQIKAVSGSIIGTGIPHFVVLHLEGWGSWLMYEKYKKVSVSVCVWGCLAPYVTLYFYTFVGEKN